jgi:biotin carboxyl carrier protein
MKRYQVAVAGQSYEVEVLGDPSGEQVEVSVDGEIFTVRVSPVPGANELALAETPPAGTPSTVAPAPRAQASRTVAAPLPGVIKMIAVRPGQHVAANDELVVIEAMKMDNVIRSAREGTIGAVHVTPGRQVSHGEPLVDYVA